jgi:ubiquinone/menaquinone biosynthesis C-methylase UbiE
MQTSPASRQGLEQRPRLYDAGMAILDALLLAPWRRSLRTPESRALLEVGCGTGRTLALHDRGEGRRVVGLDPSAQLLQAARRRAPQLPLVQARAEALPFRDGTFDTVVSSLVFCSVDDPEAGFREVARVLTPGGRLRMLEHVRPTSRLGGVLARWAQPAWTALTGGCRPDRDTPALAESSGFRILPQTLRARWILRRFDAVVSGGGPP